MGQTGGFQAVQSQLIKDKGQRCGDRILHQALTGILLTHPITHGTGLGDAASHIGQSNTSQQAVVLAAENEKSITNAIASIAAMATFVVLSSHITVTTPTPAVAAYEQVEIA